MPIPQALPPLSPAPALDDLSLSVASQASLWRFCQEHILGTRLEILIHSHSHAVAKMAALAASTEIERLNNVFNHRHHDSEIANLNRTCTAALSADLFAVVQLSETWRRITKGAFDGRLGALLRLWSSETTPNLRDVQEQLAKLQHATFTIDSHAQRVMSTSPITWSLDAIAKGYIVDAALNAARAIPTIAGIAISIGGDMRVWGDSPDVRGWRIGIADPNFPFENAPLTDVVTLNNAAIATSGRGPRDCLRDGYRSTTISPLTGYPADKVLSASVIASHVADADAIATACMVLDPRESIALIDKLDGVAARVTDAQGDVYKSARWTSMQFAATKPQSAPASASAKSNKTQAAPIIAAVWPADWELGLTYVEPERKEDQGADFRVPYIVLWITDEQNNPVSTVFMLGSQLKWQRDNFIWWGSHRDRAPNLVHLRSQATTLSGRYQVYWNGLDEALKPLPIGKYIVHLETSQEHGKHQYRSIPIDVGHDRFKKTLANEPGSGALEISYGHYNDRFKAAD